MVMVNVNGIEYSMAKRIQQKIDSKIRNILTKRDKDYVLIVDGPEGSGKSTLAFQIGAYIDPTLTLERICFTAEQFRDAIMKAEKAQCVIFDEAFLGLSSRGTLSELNKMLVSLMMQMRQKNLFVIIILPTVFMLEKYVVLHRANVLFHVYEKRGNRGFFMVFNRKKIKILYLLGKKLYNYNVVKSGFTCRFGGRFPLGEELEMEYRKKKLSALDTRESNVNDKSSLLIYKLIVLLQKEKGLSDRKMEIYLKENELPIGRGRIASARGEYGEMSS